MSLHEAITVAMTQCINERRECATISPTAVASATLDQFAPQGVEPHIAYASLEHFKSMARRVLAHHFDDRGDGNIAYAEQGEMFSGHLQDRYPVPRKRGEDPVYKLRDALTREEARWNINMLRRAADARLAHADSLEAWDQSRTPMAVSAATTPAPPILQ